MLVIIISFAAALGLFLILFLALDWNFLLSMILAAALYAALAMLLQPEKKIGKIRISSLKNGEMLHEKLGEAGEDYDRLWRAVDRIADPSCGRQGRNWRIAGKHPRLSGTESEENPGGATLYRLLSGDGGKIFWNIMYSCRIRS